MHHPTPEAFREKARHANLIPVSREVLADLETPVSAFLKVARGDHSFLLESVEGGERLARYSFIGTEPLAVLTTRDRMVALHEGGETRTWSMADGEDPLTVLAERLSRYRFADDPTLPPFAGGAVGYLGYDTVRFFERLPNPPPDDRNLPDVVVAFSDSLLIFDHVKHRIRALCNARIEGDPDAAYASACRRVDELVDRLRGPLPNAATPLPPTDRRPTANMSRQQYEDAVRTAKAYIAAGDIIQVVLSRRIDAPLSVPPFTVYRALRSVNPSPYMFYFQAGDIHLVGSSPEILVTERKGKVTVRPLAGTVGRGATEEEDAALEAGLMADEKERAEHIMLVDLGRNDIGRVCEGGSVRVDELMTVERYSHVMHIVSNVVGNLAPGKDQFDVLRACFPAGTLSGAPKVRAMEIIDELEATRRGPYGGALGYFSYSGSMDTAIILRTMVVRGDTAYIQVGAGLVADSVPEAEYVETEKKAGALLRALELATEGLE